MYVCQSIHTCITRLILGEHKTSASFPAIVKYIYIYTYIKKWVAHLKEKLYIFWIQSLLKKTTGDNARPTYSLPWRIDTKCCLSIKPPYLSKFEWRAENWRMFKEPQKLLKKKRVFNGCIEKSAKVRDFHWPAALWFRDEHVNTPQKVNYLYYSINSSF